MPVNPTAGGPADATDPKTWGTFEQSVEACVRDSSLTGVGFIFTADDPYCGVDLDNSLDADGIIKPWAKDLLVRLDSYTEISPSGRGVKVFLKANKPGKRCRKAHQDGGIEIYDRDRFFTVTGNRTQEYPPDLNLRQESLDLVYSSIFGGDEQGAICGSNANPSPAPNGHVSITLSDDEIIEHACNKPRTGDRFRALWAGDWKSQRMNSPSEADSSVVFTLAYYTKDDVQIDRIFRRSALMRPKWDDTPQDTSNPVKGEPNRSILS